MNNTLRIILVILGIALVVMAGVAVYYLHNLSADICSIHKLNKQHIHKADNQVYEYICTSCYLFADGEIDYLDKLMQDGWQVYSFLGPVVRDANRSRGGVGHIYVVLRRPKS